MHLLSNSRSRSTWLGAVAIGVGAGLLSGCAAPVTPAATPPALWHAAPAAPTHSPIATPTTVPPTPSATLGSAPAWSAVGAARRSRPVTPLAPAAPAPPARAVSVGRVYDVGDSVTLDVKPYLQQYVAGITVDGKVSRQWDTGVSIINGLRQTGRLPQTVVVDLGTNGTVTSTQFDAMMRAAAGASRVVFVTVKVPRSWESSDNAVIHAGVARYPNTALADWHGLSQGHPEWFYSDGYHLTPSGSKALASLIASVV